MKTLAEVKHAVFEFFQQENTLCPASQSNLIKFDCDDAALKRGLIIEALKELEKYEITRGFEVDKVAYWVLTKPLSTFDKPINFGYDTLCGVADVLNGYAALQNNTKLIVDATEVSERDVQRLIVICQALMPEKETAKESN